MQVVVMELPVMVMSVKLQGLMPLVEEVVADEVPLHQMVMVGQES